jgi:hypothetical protein
MTGRRICFWCDGEETPRNTLHWDLDRESWYHGRCARPEAHLEPPLAARLPAPNLQDHATWSALIDELDEAALASLFEEG